MNWAGSWAVTLGIKPYRQPKTFLSKSASWSTNAMIADGKARVRLQGFSLEAMGHLLMAITPGLLNIKWFWKMGFITSVTVKPPLARCKRKRGDNQELIHIDHWRLLTPAAMVVRGMGLQLGETSLANAARAKKAHSPRLGSGL